MNALYVDAHCHLSSDPWTLNHDHVDIKDTIDDVLQNETSSESKLLLNIMSTSHLDHVLLKKCNAFFNKHSYKLGIGIHPWYSYMYTFDRNITKLDHYLSILSFDYNEVAKLLNVQVNETDKIESFIQQLVNKTYQSYPDVYCIDDLYPNDVFFNYDFIGEVGLDFAANVKKIAYITSLNEIKVNKDHQVKILQFFLNKLTSNLSNLKFISIHSVKASQATFDVIKHTDETLQQRNVKANIVLHSYTGTIEQFNQQYLKLKNINSFISLSTFINCKMPLTKKQRKLISSLDTKHMLIETDVPITTNRMGFKFKENLENTLNVIRNYKKITFEDLRNEINKNYAGIMD